MPKLTLYELIGDAFVAVLRSPNATSAQQRLAALEALAAGHLGVAVGDVHATRKPSGAPHVEVAGKRLHASLAHRDDLLLIGYAPRPLGVDIEPIGDAQEPPWNVLAPIERTFLTAIDDPAERHVAFLRIWTIKEAALKALGTGLSREPSSLAAVLDGERPQLHVDGSPLAASHIRVEAFGGGGSDGFVWACVVL